MGNAFPFADMGRGGVEAQRGWAWQPLRWGWHVPAGAVTPAPALALVCCVTLGRSQHLSEPRFSRLCRGDF